MKVPPEVSLLLDRVPQLSTNAREGLIAALVRVRGANVISPSAPPRARKRIWAWASRQVVGVQYLQLRSQEMLNRVRDIGAEAVVAAARTHGLLDPGEVARQVEELVWPLAQHLRRLDGRRDEAVHPWTQDLADQTAQTLIKLRTAVEDLAVATEAERESWGDRPLPSVEALIDHARSLTLGLRSYNLEPQAVLAAIASSHPSPATPHNA